MRTLFKMFCYVLLITGIAKGTLLIVRYDAMVYFIWLTVCILITFRAKPVIDWMSNKLFG